MANKLILHIPHASNYIPDKVGYVVPDKVLNDEMLLLTDWHTDDIFANDDCINIIAEFNRIFCDVERFADDNDEIMASVGMGATYTKCDNGDNLRILTDQQRQEILTNYYYPHHEKLTKAVKEQLEADGKSVIIDCHSFSNEPFKRDLSQDKPRPDICIGIDEFHTPAELYMSTVEFFKQQGYSVEVNMPYSGSIVPIQYYQKDKGVQSIMIEINRHLYLEPSSNLKSKDYSKVKSVIQDFYPSFINIS